MLNALQDEEFAKKTAATLPPRILSKQLKVLVTGQPETGRTTTIRNLFASIAQDEHWTPVNTENLTMDDFRQNPAAFTTVIEDRPDVSGRLSMSYIIQVQILSQMNESYK
jgi:septin family protein